MAVILAVGGAFATQAMKSDDFFAGVEYKNASNNCVAHPQCSTTSAAIVCSNTFVSGSNCLTPTASWRPM